MLLFTPGDFIQLMPIVLSVSSVGIDTYTLNIKGEEEEEEEEKELEEEPQEEEEARKKAESRAE